ncbi:MAG: PLDc N-terminal domain-containing protein [Deltaproteobacteria bacterium]|nr:PLDc N-terminal domain-containing protein [Deltaproteobacteria bacterium]
MVDHGWLTFNLLQTLSFIVALVLLAHILRSRRSPPATMAWVLAIVLVPHLGVPLYLIFGGRKMQHMAGKKAPLIKSANAGLNAGHHGAPFISHAHEGVFAPTPDNRTVIMADGEQAFAETMHVIRDAKHFLYVATFILGRDETGRALVEAMAEKARQGLAVRLLLDALGCMNVRKKFLASLTDAGGKVAWFMPMLHIPFRGRANLRNHRKMVLADGRVALVGGMNLAQNYMGARGPVERWRDLAIYLEGPAVAHLHDIFRNDWKFAADEDIEPIEHSLPEGPQTRKATLQIIASGPDVPGDPLRDAILSFLFKANSRVWIVTPYFVPDEMLATALAIASRRGVDVRIIVPRRSNHPLADVARAGYFTPLQEDGVRVFLYQPGMLHAKAMIVDDFVAVTGSANMDMRSLLLNYELGVCVYSRHVIRELEGWMRWLQLDCKEREIVYSMPRELVQGMGRLLAPLL